MTSRLDERLLVLTDESPTRPELVAGPISTRNRYGKRVRKIAKAIRDFVYPDARLDESGVRDDDVKYQVAVRDGVGIRFILRVRERTWRQLLNTAPSEAAVEVDLIQAGPSISFSRQKQTELSRSETAVEA